ncbi:MAG: HVO_A0114 family putative DNA-binding protein [Candidatus Brocadiales bacterium]
MKVKNIKIGIRTREEAFEEASEVMKRLSRGEKVKKQTGIYFENLDAMRKILTEKRLEILHTVKKKRPSSTYELAKILRRDLTNVIDDLRYLEELGLVGLKKSKTGKEKTIPTVDYDKIRLEIGV